MNTQLTDNVRTAQQKFYGSDSTLCSNCRDRYPYSALTAMDGQLLCGDCIENCDICAQDFPFVDAQNFYDPTYRTYCPSCAAKRNPRLFCCDGCGELVDENNVVDTLEGYLYCPTCHAEDREPLMLMRTFGDVEFPAGEFLYR